MEDPDAIEPAIIVDNVSKSFKLPHEKQNSIKGLFVGIRSGKKTYEQQEALKDVSFDIRRGEFFGIVGRNGSGKSTLLKLLAGIYVPNKGAVHVNGSLTPFIELGVGFNPELTGRENVFLNGALLGFNRKQMSSMYDDIVEFAELKKFMDQKLKNYSSGMQVRLAFSIAIRAQSDILLIDEVLAVGDTAFQRKCFAYFEELKLTHKTVVLVSHDMEAVKKFCTRAALINNGKLKYIGDPSHVAKMYDDLNASDAKLFAPESPTIQDGIEITELRVVGGDKKGVFSREDDVTIHFKIKANQPITPALGVNIIREDGQSTAGISSHYEMKPKAMEPGQTAEFEFVLPSRQFTVGTHFVDGVIYDTESNQIAFFKQAMTKFKTIDTFRGWGAYSLTGKWREVKKD